MNRNFDNQTYQLLINTGTTIVTFMVSTRPCRRSRFSEAAAERLAESIASEIGQEGLATE